MHGHPVRPSIRQGTGDGRAAAVVALLAVTSLLAGCFGPAPSPAATSGASPVAGTSAAPGAPASTGPGGSPAPSASPDDVAWEPVTDLAPLAPVASLEPIEASAAGVAPDTAFRLTALDGSDPVALARLLVAEPAVDLHVKAGPGVAIVTPVQPLAEGQAYRFSLRSPDGSVRGTWAIQAVGPLEVRQAIPEDTSTGVPVDTGIELTFNQAGVAAADVERYLTIEPATPGRIEIEGRTAAFVPDAPLAASTVYTVTLRAGLPLAGTAETLGHDAVTRFETAGTAPLGIRLAASWPLVEASPSERAVITLQVDRPDEDGESTVPYPDTVGVGVHRLPGMDEAIAAWRLLEAVPDWTQQPQPAPLDTVALPVVLDADLAIRPFEKGQDWRQYVQLPDELAAGWYVVTVRHEGALAQVVLQVTDLAVYTVVTTTRSIAWVNDLGTGGPVEGAAVTLAGVDLGRTGANGIVAATTPRIVTDPADTGSVASRPVLVVREGGRAVFVSAAERQCAKCGDEAAPSPWWVLFQPDRYAYRPTDTINAWGIIRDRATGDQPAGVEVSVAPSIDGNDVVSGATDIVRRTAQPDRNGAFVVGLPVSELPFGDYLLTLRVGGTEVASRWISVSRILKPAWSMTLQASRRAVVEGQTVNVTADAAFYEGTPVAGAAIVVSAADRDATLVTDEAGTGTTSLRMRQEDDWSQWEIVQVSARPQQPEEGAIGAGTPVAVFQAAVVVKASGVVKAGTLRVTGSVHDVALGRYDDVPLADLDRVDPYGSPVPGTTVRVKVTERRVTRVKVGTEYDWVLKRVVPRYESHDREIDRGTYTVRTDAQGAFALSLDAGMDRSYDLAVSARDDHDRRTTEHAWADAVTSDPSSRNVYIGGNDPDAGYSVGDAIRLRFVGGAAAGEPSTYLWTTARDGLRDWTLTPGPRYSGTFGADDVPGFTVNAVQFTGKAYVVADVGRRVAFDVEDRRMTVQVTTDRSRYRPGDRVTLSLRTTGPGGAPVAASLYVGVVDEKLVAMDLVDLTDPLDALYTDVGAGIVGVSWTHRDPNPTQWGEGGDTTGGGGDDARSDFRDWLAARIVRTNADGRASITVDLSDDLTSWHVIASGVSGSLLGGTGDADIPVSLPFFADLTVADGYLVADRPIVRVRSFGTGLRAGDTVSFTVSSDTLPMAPVTVTARAFGSAEVPLPALTAGTHRVRVEARVGSGDGTRRDVLVRSFTVVEHRAVQSSVSYARLDGTTPVAAGTGLTSLVLADAGRGRVVPVLEALATEDPIRGDRALAAGLAARVLRDVFGMEPGGAVLDGDLQPFLQGGGYGVLPYAEGGIELSALAALSGDPRVGRLGSWLASYEPTTREERAWRLAGLAASGLPALADIRAMAALDDLTVGEQVALAVAALAAGDEALAGTIERDVLRDHGERHGPWVRVRVDGTADESVVATARLAIVAASLGEEVAVEMDAYLEANPPRTTVVTLERALAARGWASRIAAADASATLTVDGVASVVAIEASMPVTLSLTPTQAAGATLAPKTGSVLVTMRTDRPLVAGSLDEPTWLIPNRVVTPAGDVAVTDTVVVELPLGAPPAGSGGCWNVTEWVPSGLVPVSSGREDAYYDDEGEPVQGANGPWRVQGQRLDFCLEPDATTLRYVARVVTPGTYAWEPAVIQSPLESGVGAVMPATTITIVDAR